MAGAPTIRLRLCCWRGLGSEVLTYFPLVQTPEQRWLGWDLGEGERWRQWRPVIRCGRLVQLEPVGFVCIKRRDDNGLWFRSFKEQTLVSMFPRKACLVPLPGLPRQPISSCLSCQSQASFAITVVFGPCACMMPAKLDLGGSGRAWSRPWCELNLLGCASLLSKRGSYSSDFAQQDEAAHLLIPEENQARPTN
jgi:hypothetical protein